MQLKKINKVTLALALLGALTLFAGMYAAFAGVTFRPAVNHPVGNNPNGITAADFNNDGDMDLATINLLDHNVSVLLGNGNGSFDAATDFPVGNSPRGVAAADFNHDGNIDLAVINTLNDNVSVLLGDGNGSFGRATNFPAGILPIGITAADFNNDNNVDLAVTSLSDNVSILLGNGDGTFGTATDFPVGHSPFSITAADFNHDGNVDLATANNLDSSVSVLLGNGTGNFDPATGSPFTVGNGPFGITAADFNHDCNVDLAVTNINEQNVSVLLGDGTGNFTSAPGSPFLVGDGPIGITTADFNNDNNVDLAVANSGDSDVSILWGDGKGRFRAVTDFPVGDFPFGITAADFTGDNRPGLATANANSNNVSVLLQEVYGCKNNSPDNMKK